MFNDRIPTSEGNASSVMPCRSTYSNPPIPMSSVTRAFKCSMSAFLKSGRSFAFAAHGKAAPPPFKGSPRASFLPIALRLNFKEEAGHLAEY